VVAYATFSSLLKLPPSWTNILLLNLFLKSLICVPLLCRRFFYVTNDKRLVGATHTESSASQSGRATAAPMPVDSRIATTTYLRHDSRKRS
jgi:hypothetical protein